MPPLSLISHSSPQYTLYIRTKYDYSFLNLAYTGIQRSYMVRYEIFTWKMGKYRNRSSHSRDISIYEECGCRTDGAPPSGSGVTTRTPASSPVLHEEVIRSMPPFSAILSAGREYSSVGRKLLEAVGIDVISSTATLLASALGRMTPRPIHWSGLVWTSLLTDVRRGSRPPRAPRRECLRLAGQPSGVRHHRSDDSGVALVPLQSGRASTMVVRSLGTPHESGSGAVSHREGWQGAHAATPRTRGDGYSQHSVIRTRMRSVAAARSARSWL